MTAFGAVVLAGDRGADEPVAMAAGVACKALAPVAGIPMVLRVLDALEASDHVDRVVLCGPSPQIMAAAGVLSARLVPGRLDWIPAADSPSASAAAGLAALGPHTPALVTTADHPLLRSQLVDALVTEALASGADAVVGLVAHRTVAAAFPGVQRTVLRLREGGYCGTNLFAFPTAAGRRAVDYWHRVEAQRKHPWRVVAGLLGPRALLAYGLGRLTLPQAMERLSIRLGVRVAAVPLEWPEAGVDVDSVVDLQIAEKTLGG